MIKSIRFILFISLIGLISVTINAISQPPNYLYGIFGDEYKLLFNVTQLDLATGETIQYPLISALGIPDSILQIENGVDGILATIVTNDGVSMNIYQVNLETMEYEILCTMALSNQNGIIYTSTSFGYNNITSALYNTGFDYSDGSQIGADLFEWNFANQSFEKIAFPGDFLGDRNSTGTYDYDTNIYYANLFDTQSKQGVIYEYDTLKGTGPVNTPYVLPNDTFIGEIQYLFMTSNQQLFGVTQDDNSYLMLYVIDYKKGSVDLVFNTPNPLVLAGIPAVPFNDYMILLFEDNSTNYAAIVNTLTHDVKFYSLGTNMNTQNGGFYQASI